MKKLLFEILQEFKCVRKELQVIRIEMEFKCGTDIKDIARKLYDCSSKLSTSDNTLNKSSEE